MTVKELIEQLQTFPEDMEIYKSKDEEGNGYLLVDGIYLGHQSLYDIDDVRNFADVEDDEIDDFEQVLII